MLSKPFTLCRFSVQFKDKGKENRCLALFHWFFKKSLFFFLIFQSDTQENKEMILYFLILKAKDGLMSKEVLLSAVRSERQEPTSCSVPPRRAWGPWFLVERPKLSEGCFLSFSLSLFLFPAWMTSSQLPKRQQWANIWHRTGWRFQTQFGV